MGQGFQARLPLVTASLVFPLFPQLANPSKTLFRVARLLEQIGNLVESIKLIPVTSPFLVLR